jgi:hypothetical protein
MSCRSWRFSIAVVRATAGVDPLQTFPDGRSAESRDAYQDVPEPISLLKCGPSPEPQVLTLTPWSRGKRPKTFVSSAQITTVLAREHRRLVKPSAEFEHRGGSILTAK